MLSQLTQSKNLVCCKQLCISCFKLTCFTGRIPLRHLVYRVLDLPSSMQSLVYDFGQLSSETEQQYTKKIVERYVCSDTYVKYRANAECVG